MPFVSGKLHYEQSGFGKAVVLIHGLGSSSNEWASTKRVLSDHYRVIAIDIRAHGQSDTGNRVTCVGDLAEDVLTVMNHLEIKQAFFAGTGMGGVVCMQLCAEAPDRVLGVAILNTVPYLQQDSARVRATALFLPVMSRFFTMEKIAKFFASGFFKLPDGHSKDDIEKRLLAMDKQVFMDFIGALIGRDALRGVDSVNTPVLAFVSTSSDRQAPAAEKLVAMMKSASVEVAEMVAGSDSLTVSSKLLSFFGALHKKQ